MDSPILEKKSHASRFVARLQSDISKYDNDAVYFDKRDALPAILPMEPKKMQMKSASSLPMPDSKPPRPPSNTSMNSMGSTDSSGFTAPPLSLSPFSIDSGELWTSNSPEAISYRSASTQPSRYSQASAALHISRTASKSTGQLDSLPSILSSRNKARQRALAGSPLVFESHIHSPRPNTKMLANLSDLKRASSLPLDLETENLSVVALSDVGFTLFKKGRDRRNALEGLPTGEIKSTPRLSDPRELSFLTPISEANASLAAIDDIKASAPR